MPTTRLRRRPVDRVIFVGPNDGRPYLERLYPGLDRVPPPPLLDWDDRLATWCAEHETLFHETLLHKTRRLEILLESSVYWLDQADRYVAPHVGRARTGSHPTPIRRRRPTPSSPACVVWWASASGRRVAGQVVVVPDRGLAVRSCVLVPFDRGQAASCGSVPTPPHRLAAENRHAVLPDIGCPLERRLVLLGKAQKFDPELGDPPHEQTVGWKSRPFGAWIRTGERTLRPDPTKSMRFRERGQVDDGRRDS